MSNNQETLKETKELLDQAQKEVLKEINKKANFLSKLFSGKQSAESLKQVQSSISKAINQMKNLTKDESSVVAKLQSHLNEKTAQVRRLEEDFSKSSKERDELADKLKQIQATIERLQSEAHDIQETAKPVAIDHKIEEEFKQKIQALEDTSREMENKFILTKEDLSKSQALVVEFSKRMKRLKSELTSK